jgi:hypothetical protein
MGLFDRIRSSARPAGHGGADGSSDQQRVRALPDRGDQPAEDLPLKPESRGISDEERRHIEELLALLAAEGVDVDDLASIGAGYDRALATWVSKGGSDHAEIVERYAVAVGEHLHRHTDLAWEVATDVFGTDLAVVAGDFVVVPANLVAVRWMRRESGWVPKVVGHLVGLRTR